MDRVPGGRSKQLYVLPDLFHRQRMWHGWRRRVICAFVREWDWARSDERVPAFLKDVWGRSATERPELHEDERPVLVHRIYDLQRKEGVQ